jgi:hypothetical protein
MVVDPTFTYPTCHERRARATEQPDATEREKNQTHAKPHAPRPVPSRGHHTTIPPPDLAAPPPSSPLRPPMAKTRKPPPPPPAAETPSPQRRRKKKGRPSLLDLQRRSLRLQAQNPSPVDSPDRRDPNPSDDDDDGTGTGRRRQKRLKSVLAGGVKVGDTFCRAKFRKFRRFGASLGGFGRRTRGDAGP